MTKFEESIASFGTEFVAETYKLDIGIRMTEVVMDVVIGAHTVTRNLCRDTMPSCINKFFPGTITGCPCS